MKRPNKMLAVGAILALLPGAVFAFSGRNGTRVAPVNKAVFEVVVRNMGSGPEYWCGAADYARRALGAGWKTEIYIARERGASVTTGHRSAVHFTINPEAAGVTPIPPALSLNSLKVGDHMSVQEAVSQCQNLSGRF